MTPKLETALTGALTVLGIVGVGMLKQQGLIDADTSVLATGVLVGGGLGWGGKTIAGAAAPASPPD